MAPSTPTVILGAGIIGLSTAYYLSQDQDPSSIHLVESAPELFSSASGYAGGFLARDWHVPATADLARLSFAEHRRLAEEHSGREKWGYSTTVAVGYAASQEAKSKKRGDDWLRDGTSRADAAPVPVVINGGDGEGRRKVEDQSVPGWLRRREGDSVDVITEEGTTAQVDPSELCRFLMGECVKRGVKLHHPARAVRVERDGEGRVEGVVISSSGPATVAVLCSRLIITAGCWSGWAFREVFPGAKADIPVRSLAGHSIVLRSPRWNKELEEKGCHTVFTTSDEFAPEIFARVGGGIYFAGLNSATIPLPDVAGTAKPHVEALQLLKKTAADIMGSNSGDNDLEVVKEGLCFRPIFSWGLPVVSRLPDEMLGQGVSTKSGSEGGVFLATGHGPWGISLSLGTGKVLAEMVQGRRLSADISALGLRDGQE